MRYLIKGSLALLLCTQVTLAFSKGFDWPNGEELAVVLSYDDSLDSHLDKVIPQLDAEGLRATFYLSGARDGLHNRLDEWRAVANKGHELGNHTLYHSCRKSLPDRDWVAPFYDLDKYTLKQFEEEIKVTNTLLKAIDGKEKRTFAYPCGDVVLNEGKSLIPILEKHMLAARHATEPSGETDGLSLDGLESPESLNQYLIKAIDVSGFTGEQLVQTVEASLASNGLLTFVFHGVVNDGEYLTVSPEAHQQLVDYLSANKSKIWTAPMREVVEYIGKQ